MTDDTMGPRVQTPERKTAATERDGAAAEAVDKHWPRRKRYTIELDLDARPPADPEPNAPLAPLDL